MTTEQLAPLVQSLSHWETPDPAAWSAFTAILRSKVLSPGELWVRAGDLSGQAAFLSRGLLRYFALAPSGKELTRYFCQGQNFVCSQTALLTGKPSLFSLQALTEAELLVFKWAEWRSLTARYPVFARLETRILEQALVTSEKREWSLVLEDAATRYRRFLADFPGIESHLKMADVATYLGVAAETLSRIRKNLTSS